MLPNNSQEFSSGNYIGIQPTNNIPTPPVIHPTVYPYLELLPAILTALTPLVLGLKKKNKDDEDKE